MATVEEVDMVVEEEGEEVMAAVLVETACQTSVLDFKSKAGT